MCAGEYEKMEILRRAEDLVIAVDGGLPRLLAQGIEPDLILGDFDSLGEDLFPLLEKLERTGRKKVLRLPREKDDTDTIYAARLCLEQGYRDFLIYGALGGRLDHTMANIQTLAWLRERDARAYLVGKTTLVSVLSSEKVTFPENFEGIFSLFALDSRVTGVTLEGMKYPLQDLSGIYEDFDQDTEFDLVKQKNGCRGLFNGFCYPRFIKLHECILHTINNELFCDDSIDREIINLVLKKYQDKDFEKDEKQDINYLKRSFDIYKDKNFKKDKNMYEDYIENKCRLDCSDHGHCPLKIYDEKQFKDINIIKIAGKRKDKIKVGLLNTNLNMSDFEKRILGKPNLSSRRFDKIKILINEAIKKNDLFY